MSQSISRPRGTARFPTAKRRALATALLIAVLAVAASSETLHGWLIAILSWTQAVIQSRPVLGMSVFVLYAAAAAMLAFLGSAPIVPVGVYAWGKGVSMVLLWTGWILGGACSYGIGRFLGRPVVKALRAGEALERYEKWFPARATFSLVLLFQIALPSEVPGYLLGIARYSFWRFLASLALAELPYAAATIYLGAGFIERQTWLLIGVGAALVALAGWSLYALHRRLSGN
jgi:uncharacterized membrane protein YdjX (TVP38/TMEM64 family)